jgi:DNA-binding CsgD family transcriptional regulator
MGTLETDKTSTDHFRKTGISAALFMLFFLFTDWISPPSSSPATIGIILNRVTFKLVVCVIALLLSISAFVSRLYWLQPTLMLALVPLPMIAHISNMFSLGFFICAALLLDGLGFFKKHKRLKVAICTCYYCLCQIGIGLHSDAESITIILSLLASLGICAFLCSFLSEVSRKPATKPVLSLASLGITKTEGEYLRALMEGASIKEIAANIGVRESTVRNTLARVYKKFEVHDKAMLLAKCEKYTIVD